MKRMWAWWLARCDRETDVRPLALVRILVPWMVILDLLRVLQLGLVEVLFRPESVGGLSSFTDDSAFIHEWSPMWAGPIAFWVTIGCMLLVSVGRWMKPAILMGCFAYAQLGHIYPPGDRAIDRILRCVLLFLLFSKADHWWAFNKKERLQRIPAWPVDLIKWMLVMVYMAAGLSKILQQPAWMAMDGMPVLYRIMTDPLASDMDPAAWTWAYPLFRFGSWSTIILEIGAVLILTRWCHWWAILGAMMHLGIAATMNLGMFSWGMLALYPVLLSPWLLLGLQWWKEKKGLAPGPS